MKSFTTVSLRSINNEQLLLCGKAECFHREYAPLSKIFDYSIKNADTPQSVGIFTYFVCFKYGFLPFEFYSLAPLFRYFSRSSSIRR